MSCNSVYTPTPEENSLWSKAKRSSKSWDDVALRQKTILKVLTWILKVELQDGHTQGVYNLIVVVMDWSWTHLGSSSILLG